MDREPANARSSQRTALTSSGSTNYSAQESTVVTAPSGSHVSATGATPTRPLRLCVLEDSYSHVQLIMRACQERGHQADHFAHIDDALNALGHHAYDVVIVSDTMAGGVDACHSAISRVRGLPDQNTADIPILAIASSGDANRCYSLEALGASATLSELSDAHLAAALTTLGNAQTAAAVKAPIGKQAALLLESSHNLTLVLNHALTQTGYSVDHVTTIDQATEAFSEHEYEIILLSQTNTPGPMSTVQLIEHLHASRGHRTFRQRIWVLTADATPANVKSLRTAGAEHVLDKRDPIRLGNAVFALSAGKVAKPAGAKTVEQPIRAPRMGASTAPAAATQAPAEKSKANYRPSISLSHVRRFVGPTLGFFALTTVVAGGVWFGWQNLFAKTPVEAVYVQRGNVEVTAAATGLVVSKRQVDLPPTQTGQLYRVFVNEGDLVRKGELLATLDNREATVNVRRAEAQVFRFRTELDLADKALRAWRAASEGETSAQIEVDAQSTPAMARTKLRVAEQELEAARVTLDRLKITAPFAGAITRSTAIEGKWAVAGAPLFTLSDLNAREVALHVPVDMAQNLATGQPVRLLTETNAGEQWQEKIVRVVSERATDKRASAHAQTTVYVTLGDDATALQLGQRVLAKIVTDVATNTNVVPFDAVVVQNGKNYVAVVNDGRVVMRAVELGIQNEREVAVRAGLKPGEAVITSHINVENGQRVAISNTPPAVAARDVDRGSSAR